MSYSIPSSIEILTLATAPFLLVNLLWCQVCTLYCTLLFEVTNVRFQQHIHQKDLNLRMPLFYYDKVIAEGKNTNKEFNCIYGACNLTKSHFEIPICFWFQLIFLRNLFLKFGKFLVLCLGCGCMTFNLATQMTLSHLLAMPINKNIEGKDPQICSKNIEKDL